MGETVTLSCPWCGEPIEIWVERDAPGTAVQDCDVCCRPCVIESGWDDERGAWAVAQRE